MNEEEFTPRNYQVELMKIALEQNTIIFLPTGSGKTFIALMVLKQKGESLLKSYGQGGKISIILVNTVALVDQHADYITKHTNFKVGKYTGEMNLDFWPKDKWYTEYEKYQVLVMTSQILYNLVLNSYIDINKVNLLIFDECHRGVNDHSMRQIMKSFQNCTEQPRVLGLTATLLNGNCKPGKVMQQVRDLEVTYQSKVATVEELKDVVGYSTNPMENIMRFYAHSTVENEQFSICVLNNNIDILEKVKMTNDVCVPLSLKGLKPLDVKEERKKLVNLVKDLIFHIENLGCYGGVKACLAHSIQIERIKKHCEDLNFLTVLNYIQTTFTYVIELLNQQMVGYTEREKIYNCSSDQLIALIKIFKEFRLRSEEDLCCIIFTKRRFTAKVIYHILDALSKCDPEYSYIKANFMVGHNNNPYNDTRETMYIHKQNRQVLTSFANKEINVLVASNVLEEGVDIPKCTLVIKYDYPQDYRSYIQSKGRARHKKSLYYMMVSNEDIDKFSEKYQEFQMVETVLNDYLIGKNEQRSEPSMMDIEAMYNEDLIPPYYVPSTGAQINMLSAISTLCQYCSLLPSDVYTVHAPDWFIREVHAGKRVVILLPTICGILEPIEGPTMPNTKFAKRAAALKACIVLHKSGELDDHLLPIKKSVQEEDVSYLFTHYPEKKEEKAGNLKTRRLHEKLIPRTLSEPIKPDSTVNLHIIQLEPQFARKHEDIHLATLYDMYTSPICYGIITNAPLPTLCDFPIYVTLGTINVSLKVNQRTVTITEADLDNIKTFHVQVFDGVLEILKRFLMFDKSDNLEMMLLVPINKQQSDIDWNILKERIPVNVVQEPSNEEKYNLEVTQESHLRKIISPWHRRDPATYIVTEVCLNKNAHSPFPNEEYSSFIDYFKSKHNLQLRNPNLPLLLAKKLTKNLNFIKPKGRTSVKRKHDKMHVELEEYLPAELVVKQEFPASLWIQANFIPTILTRISFMLQLEELRCRIAKEKKGLGIEIVSVKQPLQLDEYLLDYEPYIEELPDEELMPANGVLALPQSQIHVNKDFTKKCLECQYPWKDIDEPTDIERNLDVSIMDIEHYESFIGCLTNETRELRISPKEEKPKALTYHKDFVHKKIHLLEMPTCRIGPELCELYKALTSAKANEIVNLERLETLGDSLLKLVVSIYIYSRFPQYDEGRATQLKGRLVSNRNLFYLALRKNLNGVIKYNELSPKEEWLPPAFAIPDRMLQRINNKELSLGALFGLNLSLEEQVSGKLNSETLDEIIDDECPPTDTEESNYSSMAHFLKSQYIGDKHIADVVESLIGVYFKTCGFAGGLKIIEWLGLIPESENLERIFLQSFPSPLLTKDNVENKIRVHLPLRHEIEEIIGYTFKNKAYLLQALTHSSYTPNRTTLSYEKLEFLGDAVLDFLITCHIYESCGNLDPGELTDLRSALVNNNTFASLVVRLGLHKYLLMINSKLQRLVDKFVTFMEQKNYVIDDEVMILLQEDEYQMAESVDVPKILGDIFEAIAGAIYLDSDNDLKTVWRVFYKIMWKEIDLFSQNVPKNVVRKLFEWNSAHPKFGKPTLAGKNKCMVPLQFVLDGIPALVHGFGANKAMARKAAAKLALQSLDKKNR